MKTGFTLSLLTAAMLIGHAPARAESKEYIIDLPVCEDTYVRNGEHSDKNFGSEKTLALKGSEINNYERKIYLKFDAPQNIDKSFKRAVLEIEFTSKETPTRELSTLLYSADPASWSESTLTYNTQPSCSDLTGSASAWGDRLYIDVTESVKKHISEGSGFSYVLTGDYSSPLRADFSSREGKAAPKIRLYYGDKNYFSALSLSDKSKPDPYKQADKMLELSTAKELPADPDNIIKPIDCAFVRGGKYAGTNFGGYRYISCDGLDEPSDMPRKAYLKFDLSQTDKSKIGKAYIDMHIETIHDNKAHEVELAAVSDNTWSESTITWKNAPKHEKSIARALADVPGAWISFDVTNYIKSCNRDTVSVALLDTSKYRVDFASKNHPLAPVLRIESANASQSEYTEATEAKLYPATPDYTSYPTRLLSSISGFKEADKSDRLSKYGGSKSAGKCTSDGYFDVKKINGRWWFTDPQGYLFYNMGVSAIMAGNSDAEKESRKYVYGSDRVWAQETTKALKAMGFNAAGGWSDSGLLGGAAEPLSESRIVYFLKSYMSSLGLDNSSSGSTTFSSGALNVFDPEFEEFCDKLAEEHIAPFKYDKKIIGWISDNELPASEGLLDIYLNLDPTDEKNAYSYAAAWQWFKNRTGNSDPSLSDITDELRAQFRGFVYDRYFSVVSKAIKKYDPNHLYLGCRFTNEGYASSGIISAGGKYCDVLTMNYYGAWTPEKPYTSRWSAWSGEKPFMVTEWYAMAYDSGLACTSGAGFRVKTQSDRGSFYQNYALGLMEEKSCVGFDWFKYMDNDPNALGRDSSNLDGNKGIFSVDLKPYTLLCDKMTQVNNNAYNIIKFFDARNK